MLSGVCQWGKDVENKGLPQWKMECKTHKNLPFWLCSNGIDSLVQLPRLVAVLRCVSVWFVLLCVCVHIRSHTAKATRSARRGTARCYGTRSPGSGSTHGTSHTHIHTHAKLAGSRTQHSIRFTIRYNWRVKDATFAFYPSKGEAKKGECLLPDWKWDRRTSTLAPIKRNNGEKTKDMQPWKVRSSRGSVVANARQVSGRVPLILVLILAVTGHLQGTHSAHALLPLLSDVR